MINDLWYKNAIIYCLSISTFMDANGDGIGDFRGLMNRLDYLQGIGVTAIWLMPFQPSPFRDDGYDVADYYGVDPATALWATSLNSRTAAGSEASASSSIWSSIIRPTSIRGFRTPARTPNPSIATGTCGRKGNPNTPAMEWFSRASRNPPGTTTAKRAPGTSTVSMISSRT